mmetsp:Transcript_127394/g.407743  ORF Transcript_127394/g.407743 Transcript_127394/m.407743 type:complete len:338 (-) Transcript_127394:337-1350(-)
MPRRSRPRPSRHQRRPRLPTLFRRLRQSRRRRLPRHRRPKHRHQRVFLRRRRRSQHCPRHEQQHLCTSCCRLRRRDLCLLRRSRRPRRTILQACRLPQGALERVGRRQSERRHPCRSSRPPQTWSRAVCQRLLRRLRNHRRPPRTDRGGLSRCCQHHRRALSPVPGPPPKAIPVETPIPAPPEAPPKSPKPRPRQGPRPRAAARPPRPSAPRTPEPGPKAPKRLARRRRPRHATSTPQSRRHHHLRLNANWPRQLCRRLRCPTTRAAQEPSPPTATMHRVRDRPQPIARCPRHLRPQLRGETTQATHETTRLPRATNSRARRPRTATLTALLPRRHG